MSAIGINSARGHQHRGDTHAQHAVTTSRSLEVTFWNKRNLIGSLYSSISRHTER
jgi:hypothetical protein